MRAPLPDARWRPSAASVGVGLMGTAVCGLALVRRQPLSWDEAVTAQIAARPVHDIIVTLGHSDAVLGAYYLLIHGWVGVLGSVGIRATDTWLRLPSAVATVATAVLVAVTARRSAGRRAAVVAGGVFAALPLATFYAVDARPYALTVLTVTSAWALWARPGRHPLRNATLTSVMLLVAAWLQLFTVLVWPAFLIVAGARRRAACAVLGGAAVGVLPLVWVARGQTAEIGWIPGASLVNTTRVGLHVVGGVAVLAALLALAAVVVRRAPLRRSAPALALTWWAFAPFLLLAALDVVRPVLVARYALVSLPAVAVGVGVVVARAGGGRAGVAVRALGAAVVASALVTTAVQAAQPWKYEDYRAAAAFARTTAVPGTGVLFAPPSARLGFLRYAGDARWRDLAMPGGIGPDPLALRELPTLVVRAVTAARCSVLLVGDPAATTAGGPRPDAVAGWRTVSVRSFGQVSVALLANPRCTGTRRS